MPQRIAAAMQTKIEKPARFSAPPFFSFREQPGEIIGFFLYKEFSSFFQHVQKISLNIILGKLGGKSKNISFFVRTGTKLHGVGTCENSETVNVLVILLWKRRIPNIGIKYWALNILSNWRTIPIKYKPTSTTLQRNPTVIGINKIRRFNWVRTSAVCPATNIIIITQRKLIQGLFHKKEIFQIHADKEQLDNHP